MKLCGVVLVLVCVVCGGEGGHVLVVFPTPSRSHGMLGESLVTTLLDAGHQVTFVTTLSKKLARPGLTVANISSIVKQMGAGEKLSLMELVRNPRPPQRLLQIGTSFAERALKHQAVQELLLDTDLSFDAVVAEWFFSTLLAPLASVFECPLIWYSGLDISWMTLQLVHGQTNPAYSEDLQTRSMAPIPSSPLQKALKIWQQLYLNWWMYYVTQYVEIPAYSDIYKMSMELRGRPLPNYESQIYNGSLLLVNSHPLLGQVLPMPANAKYVGGHHLELPPKTLPENLKTVLDKAKNGAIFFSLGSNVKSKDLPEQVKTDLLSVFGQLEQTVLWKFEEQLDHVPHNVHILDWAPQASILNHPNTVMLISHGGTLSCMEATYFGVPIVAIPLFGDQFINADLLASRGRGIRVDFSDQLPYKIKYAINEILGNYSYQSNAKQASAILQNSMVPPKREFLYWVELVIKTRGAMHLRSPALKLSLLDRYHIDILAMVAALLWFLTKVVKVFQVHLAAPGGDQELNKKDN